MALHMQVAWSQIQGTRDYQQDHAAVTAWDNGFHLLILSDGMGGARGGGHASRIVVETMREHFLRPDGALSSDKPLVDALQSANNAVYEAARSDPELEGMGATVVAVTFDGATIDWISVGDSPLYLFRGRRLRRLNANHSMAAVLAARVAAGEISAEQAASAPERAELLAAVMGEDIALVDEPDTPVALREGDMLVLASDGLEVLGSEGIERILSNNRDRTVADLARNLLAAVEDLGRTAQDNTTVVLACIEEQPA
jgi:serine/threonine protein phosphatase PrpC